MTDIRFWKDRAAGTIDPTLFSKKAEDMAKEIAAAHEASRQRKENKRTQIRKFYDEVLRLDNVAQAKPDQWDNVLPQLHMLTAKAAYAKGRELISDGFLDFIKKSVEQIEGKQDLRVFASFFEAFMGFYRMYGPRS